MNPLRLFVSSPSDVGPERARVDVVATRLNSEFDGLARIDVVRWETGFYTADRSFQEAIDGAVDRMNGTDVVVCILWKRVGSELNPQVWHRADGTPYESGTVLEVEAAVEVARQKRGVPDVYLFRKTAPVSYASESYEVERAQHQLLEAVWRRWTATEAGHNVAGYQRFDDPDDFEMQLELCLRQWLERKGIVIRTVWDRRLKGSPFRGLEAFEAEHSGVFFGRETAIARAIAKLRRAEEAGTPFLVVVGASGSGKSSLLRAGLVPRITRPGTIPDIDLWRAALVAPTGDPLESLAEALFAETALDDELRAGDFGTPELLAKVLGSGGAVAAAPIRAALERAARRQAETLSYEMPRPARLLIAVDQIERVFVETDPGKGEAFAELLKSLVEQGIATVVVALRSDAYAPFQQVAAFVALIDDQHGATYNLLPPTQADLEDIVTGPVAACHPPLAFEAGARRRSLAEMLVEDAKGGDALPLLQMALQRLYEAEARRADGVLRFADYPGLGAAVADTANRALATLGAPAQAELPALLTALVGDIAADAAGDAQPVGIALDRAAFERGLASRAALVGAFIARRLLTAEDVGGRGHIRAVHDALLRTWPEAVRIIGENAALIRVRHTLEPMVGDWAAAPADAKPAHLATSPALLAGAERLLERHGDDLAPAMQEFIAASLAADQRRRDTERRRQRRVLMATACGLVVALCLAGIAGWQWRVAQTQRERAEHSLVLATQTANGLIFDLAQQFRDAGLPAETIADILERARKLQEQLSAGGEISPGLRYSEASALAETATTLLKLGKTEAALAAAQQAHDIFQSLVAATPDNTDWQRDLAVCEQKIGDVLQTQGNLAGALASYRDSLAIARTLAQKGPENKQWQRDLAVSEEKVGEVLQAQGDLAGALALYRDDMTIAKALVQDDPDNTGWQRDLALSDDKIGDVLQAQDDFAGGLVAYRDGLAIIKTLAQRDPGNTGWQRNFAVSNERIGEMLQAQGDLAGALAAYRDSLAIIKSLALNDPGNTGWQRDLAVSNGRIGEVLQAQGDLAEALVTYRDNRAIFAVLAQKDPGDTGWQRDLAVSDEGIGGVLQAQRDLAGALAMYRDSLAIFGALVQKDPGNTDWQLDLATSNDKFGDVLRMRGELPGALAAYRDGLAIARTLAQKDPENILWQRNLAYALSRIAGIEPEVGDAAGALGAEEERLAVRRHLYAVSPTPGAKSDLGDALGNLSFTLLLNRRPQDALDRAMEALALDPSALWIEANRAHALLFLGRFDDAKAIYLEDKDKALGSGKTFGDAVKDDFAEFRRNGIDTPELKTIEDLLAS